MARDNKGRQSAARKNEKMVKAKASPKTGFVTEYSILWGAFKFVKTSK